MVDSRLKAKIINAIRRLSRSWAPRNQAKHRAKRGPSIYECASCQVLCYEGESVKNFNQYSKEYDRLIMERGHMDHISPVVDPKVGFLSFDLYIERTFSPIENWQHLCTTCHKAKTKTESKTRYEYKTKPSKKRTKK